MTGADGPPLGLLPPVVIIVLDVHGVVSNNPLVGFFHDLADRNGIASTEFIRQWRSTWRRPFWEGRIIETQLWNTLAPDIDHQEPRNDLERDYAPGPWFDFAAHHDGPIWLLSNHRTEWLLPRLERFAILDRFDRIIVSDPDRNGQTRPRRLRPTHRIPQRRLLRRLGRQRRNGQKPGNPSNARDPQST